MAQSDISRRIGRGAPQISEHVAGAEHMSTCINNMTCTNSNNASGETKIISVLKGHRIGAPHMVKRTSLVPICGLISLVSGTVEESSRIL